MDGKITEEILASYLKCAYKSHLQSLGMSGIRSDYETMLAKSCSDYKQKVVDKIIERSSNNESIQNVVLNRQLIQQGLSYLLNVKAENEDLCLTFD